MEVEEMKDFVYHVPTKIYFGRTALDHLGETLKQFGDRVLLIYGGGSIKKVVYMIGSWKKSENTIWN